MIQRKATILADYNFTSTAKVDNLYQFVNCQGVGGRELARDIRAGVIPIRHTRVVIALGNDAQLDRFTNIPASVTGVINALIERIGCVRLQVVIIGLLPRRMIDEEQVQVLKEQNVALYKVVRSLVRRRRYPVEFLPAYKWFLKRVKNPDSTIEIEPDSIYYEKNSDQLNYNGQVHLHLLLAGHLKLKKVTYKWEGMPLLVRKDKKKVVLERRAEDVDEHQSVMQGKVPLQLRKGHGNRRVRDR